MPLPSRELEQDTEVCSEGYMLTEQEPGHMARKNSGDYSTAMHHATLDTGIVWVFLETLCSGLAANLWRHRRNRRAVLEISERDHLFKAEFQTKTGSFQQLRGGYNPHLSKSALKIELLKF